VHPARSSPTSVRLTYVPQNLSREARCLPTAEEATPPALRNNYITPLPVDLDDVKPTVKAKVKRSTRQTTEKTQKNQALAEFMIKYFTANGGDIENGVTTFLEIRSSHKRAPVTFAEHVRRTDFVTELMRKYDTTSASKFLGVPSLPNALRKGRTISQKVWCMVFNRGHEFVHLTTALATALKEARDTEPAGLAEFITEQASPDAKGNLRKKGLKTIRSLVYAAVLGRDDPSKGATEVKVLEDED
jgi:hypothetical protein